MEMILSGRMIDAVEAERIGIVARIVPTDKLQEEALALATKIASLSQPVIKAAKQVVRSAFDLPLAEGAKLERKMFHAMFALEDQKEGMTAFVEKRPPNFQNK